MDLKIIYEDSDVLVVDKPARVIVFNEATSDNKLETRTLIDLLLEKYPKLAEVGSPPRYGVVHRLDKDTSGVLLVAKTAESLIFLQKQFKNREVEKKYTALVCGTMKDDQGTIHTLIGRAKGDSRKQKAYSLEHSQTIGLREAITEYKVLEKFADYTLLEVQIKTGRKHQIRCHLAYIHHPIAGDKMYGFKDSPTPDGLERQFLHAFYLKIKLPDGQTKEFNSGLPEELKRVIANIQI